MPLQFYSKLFPKLDRNRKQPFTLWSIVIFKTKPEARGRHHKRTKNHYPSLTDETGNDVWRHWQQNPAAHRKYEVHTRNVNRSTYENQLMSLIDTGVSSPQNRGNTDQRIRKTLTLFQYVKQKTKQTNKETRRELSQSDKGHLWKPTANAILIAWWKSSSKGQVKDNSIMATSSVHLCTVCGLRLIKAGKNLHCLC